MGSTYDSRMNVVDDDAQPGEHVLEVLGPEAGEHAGEVVAVSDFIGKHLYSHQVNPGGRWGVCFAESFTAIRLASSPFPRAGVARVFNSTRSYTIRAPFVVQSVPLGRLLYRGDDQILFNKIPNAATLKSTNVRTTKVFLRGRLAYRRG